MKPVVANNKPIAVELKEGEKYFFCRCGRSADQPFCDGSHRGTGFMPLGFLARKDGVAYLCCCKQTEDIPYCDGSHNKVPDDKVGTEFSLRDQ